MVKQFRARAGNPIVSTRILVAGVAVVFTVALTLALTGRTAAQAPSAVSHGVTDAQIASASFARTEGTNCLFLTVNATRVTQKTGASVEVFVAADYFLVLVEADCSAGGGPSMVLGAGSTNNVQFAINQRLTEATMTATIPDGSGNGFPDLAVDLTFQGVIGTLNPFHFNQLPAARGMGTGAPVVQHFDGYSRTAQVSGTAIAGGTDYAADPFSSGGGLSTQTIREVTLGNLLLR